MMNRENETVNSIMSAIANGKGKALNQQGEILQRNIQASDIVKTQPINYKTVKEILLKDKKTKALYLTEKHIGSK